ncbi:MAG: hypothetical protein R6W76_02815, partial [Caldilinea sp.]
DVRFVAQDLLTTDGTGVLPAAAIRADTPATAAQPSTAVTGSVTLPLSMALTVDLRGGGSGGYAGDALIYYALPGGAETPKPVRLTAESLGLTVNVKAPPWWPAIVLALGLLLGIGLTTYREQLAPVDRLLVRLAAIQNRLEGDAELGKQAKGAALRELAERAIADALAMLRAGDQQNATRLAQRAEAIVDLWARERARWLKALEMQQGLLEQIGEVEQKLETAAAVQSGAKLVHARDHLAKLRTAVEGAVDSVTEAVLADANKGDGAHAGKLVTRLEALRGKLRVFAELAAELIQIAGRLAQAPNPDHQRRFETLLGKLDTLDAAASLDVYTGQIDPLVVEARALYSDLTASKVREPLPAGAPAPDLGAAGLDLFAVLLYDGALPMTPADLMAQRGSIWRLRIVTWVSWLVALILLGGIGFNQLYVTQATFGAAPWADYFGLFAWGFGVEVTRNAVVQMVQGWGIPARSPATP